MQEQSYQIVTGVVITIIIFLLIGFFILVLIAYFNNRKKKFYEEKQTLQQQYTEQLLKSQLEMQEQTFNTISREIHDNVGQILSLAKVQLNIIDQSETLDKTMLADAKDSVSKAMTDLRDIAKSLNSERIQLASLPEMAGHELQRISRTGIMLASLRTEGDEQNIESEKKLIVFRIIQESLQNIIKHSKASSVNLCFFYNSDHLKIEIADNGTGFDTDISKDKKAGLGLQNIISRAALIGGEASVNSIIDKGTTITITTPYA